MKEDERKIMEQETNIRRQIIKLEKTNEKSRMSITLGISGLPTTNARRLKQRQNHVRLSKKLSISAPLSINFEICHIEEIITISL